MTLEYLAEREPDVAAEAEAVVSALELDAALTALPAEGLPELLDACVASGRQVAVISDLSEPAVLATLRARGMNGRVAAVAPGMDSTWRSVTPRVRLNALLTCSASA
ncbi:hypothetical protein [Micromonospora sp. LOL_023]|uniref:hypothetical protein n=1 Tax=Micromonospora sp. LOL_023 TaxID=3345418 RepID=UPI003A861E71